MGIRSIIEEELVKLRNRVDALEERLNSMHTHGVAITIVRDKEYDRVIEEMAVIRHSYGDHQSWSPRDLQRFTELKTRRNELRKLLGIKV